MNLVFATHNKHKLEEIKKILPSHIQIASLDEIGCNEELPETGNTFDENAFQKALYVFEKYGYSCFADDSGLEVEALGGRPGVYSARYSGDKNKLTLYSSNNKKLLAEMNQESNRKAQFRTVIALVKKVTNDEWLMTHEKAIYSSPFPRNSSPANIFFFEGTVKGEITLQPRGTNGFGYDPLFIPKGFHSTFAEMNPEMKNRISHRALAVKQLAEALPLAMSYE